MRANLLEELNPKNDLNRLIYDDSIKHYASVYLGIGKSMVRGFVVGSVALGLPISAALHSYRGKDYLEELVVSTVTGAGIGLCLDTLQYVGRYLFKKVKSEIPKVKKDLRNVVEEFRSL